MGTTVTSTGITFNDATTQSTAAVSFPTGTLMLFQQTAAPTGWTKQTTHNDKALRVVSGTAGSGGTSAFSTAFATPSVNVSGLSASATTLSTAQMPSHAHGQTSLSATGAGGYNGPGLYTSKATISNGNFSTQSTGGGDPHTHSLSGSASATINVQYVDLIIASKN